MDIKSGLHLGCAKVASLIKGTYALFQFDVGQPLEKIKDILSTGCKGAVEKKDDKKEDTK
jgi:hypothetical protein